MAGKTTSNYLEIKEEAKRLRPGFNSITELAQHLFKKHEPGISFDSFRRNIGNILRSEEQKDGRKIIVIGDLHEPFCLDGYREFCKKTYDKYNCNQVIFIGDIIDNHYSSFHETDADGLGGGDELSLARAKISEWYNLFPKADIIIGNHDRMIMRKAQTSSIPREWIKEYSDVLETPGWSFVESIVYDDVLYIHGEGGMARTKMKAELMSLVQGHLHSQMYTEWIVGRTYRIFGVQVGCGIDHKSYAMAYAKSGKKPAIGCAVILENGNQPINIPMKL